MIVPAFVAAAVVLLLSTSCVTTQAASAAPHNEFEVPFHGVVTLPLHGHVAFSGTVDVLRAAGLQPIPVHQEPKFVPQATKTFLDSRRLGRKRKTVCESEDWRKQSLKNVREIPIAGVLGDLEGETKFEASGIAKRGNSTQYFVVFDNIRALGEFDERFQFKSNKSRLVPDGSSGAANGIEDSQFEGITHIPASDTLLVVKEEAEHGDHYHPIIEEMKLSEDGASYTVIDNCTVDFELSHANKGFEGIQFHDDGEGGRWLLGLCEGNFCSGGKHGRIKGNGRIVLSKYYKNDKECGWETKKIIKVPESANFADYSDMAFRGNRLAITSQEDSEVWLGDFDFEKMEFLGNGEHYHFPRNDNCEQIYCNVEGVEWIDDDRLMLASDRAKATQPFICTPRDQSVHVMVLPHGHKKGGGASGAAALRSEL
jgi:hypothetical protein